MIEPNCYKCIHSLTCFLRIETVRNIQSFKLIAENLNEINNTGAVKQADDIFTTIAQACTAWAKEQE